MTKKIKSIITDYETWKELTTRKVQQKKKSINNVIRGLLWHSPSAKTTKTTSSDYGAQTNKNTKT